MRYFFKVNYLKMWSKDSLSQLTLSLEILRFWVLGAFNNFTFTYLSLRQSLLKPIRKSSKYNSAVLTNNVVSYI